jgi:hypothetical protein
MSEGGYAALPQEHLHVGSTRYRLFGMIVRQLYSDLHKQYLAGAHYIAVLRSEHHAWFSDCLSSSPVAQNSVDSAAYRVRRVPWPVPVVGVQRSAASTLNVNPQFINCVFYKKE